MDAFLDLISTFPTALWSVPLGVSLCLGLLTIFGAMDFDTLDVDADVAADAGLDLDADVELPGHGLMHGVTDALAIGTVPLTIVMASISTLGWLLSVGAEITVAPMVRDLVGAWIYGGAMLALTFLLAVWLTTYVVKPLRPVFITHTQHEGDRMLGQRAVLSSSTVSATFGTAIAKAADGTSLNLNVVCDSPNALTLGDEVTIVAYDAEAKHYVIAPLDPAKRIVARAVAETPPGADERLPTDLAEGHSDRPSSNSGENA